MAGLWFSAAHLFHAAEGASHKVGGRLLGGKIIKKPQHRINLLDAAGEVVVIGRAHAVHRARRAVGCGD